MGEYLHLPMPPDGASELLWMNAMSLGTQDGMREPQSLYENCVGLIFCSEEDICEPPEVFHPLALA